jgi:hypothetical protein
MAKLASADAVHRSPAQQVTVSGHPFERELMPSPSPAGLSPTWAAQAGSWRSTNTTPPGATWRAQAASRARRRGWSATLTRRLASTTASKRRRGRGLDVGQDRLGVADVGQHRRCVVHTDGGVAECDQRISRSVRARSPVPAPTPPGGGRC